MKIDFRRSPSGSLRKHAGTCRHLMILGQNLKNDSDLWYSSIFLHLCSLISPDIIPKSVKVPNVSRFLAYRHKRLRLICV